MPFSCRKKPPPSSTILTHLIKNGLYYMPPGVVQPGIRGYFAVCGNMMQPVGPEQTSTFIDNHLALITAVSNVPSKVFLGRITFGLLEPDIRKQMQGIPNMAEYDNLKRTECMAFGKEVLGRCEMYYGDRHQASGVNQYNLRPA